MGASGSSLLDESKCAYIRGKTEAVIKNFSPHYRRQYAVSFCKHVQNELEQNRDLQSQFLKTKPPAESSVIFYEGEVLHFAEDLKKWKDRYIVIKNNYAVESFENKEAFQKGLSSKSCIFPVGGKVLTTEKEYNSLSDKHFPDPNASNEKENAQAFVILPKEFPVYLWQPFLRHSYFGFADPEAQKQFSAILNDCIRHLNHDFFKQASFEAQAFLEAIQFFRQEKGHYGTWEMVTGNEIQILSNLVMEELLPSLQNMLLPKMKGKRNDRKRAWFGILEDTYRLVQEQVSEGLHTLKEECREVTKGLEGTIRSDMDQIVNSKNFLAGKIKESVADPVQKCCGESIQPFLASILEELMGPVSSGFSEVRLLFEKEVNEISQNFQATNDNAKLAENVDLLMSLPYNSVKMEPCYLKVNLLQEELQDLKSRFKFYHMDLIIQRTQNLMQELMENAVYTFEQLLSLSHQKDMAKTATAIEKVKLRVLKQYDYDSSTVRKKIFQDALIQISLPTLQRTLASTCKPELQKYEQFIFADHTSVIQVENVYEEILLETLFADTLKVIKEAAHLKKHNLFEETRLPSESVSSLSDLKTPSGSAQASPARKAAANLTEVSHADIQSNEVFVLEKITPEGCSEAKKTLASEEGIYANISSIPAGGREEGMISDLSGKQELPCVILAAVEETITPQLPEIQETNSGGGSRTENEVLGEEKKLPPPDSLNEIRSLLTVAVELPAEDPPKNKEESVHECAVSMAQESVEERNTEDKMIADECQTCELQESPKVHFLPTVEAGNITATSLSLPTADKSDFISVISISGEGNHSAEVDSPDVPEELNVCQASEANLETTTSIWYTDTESGSADDQSQAKQHVEGGQSDQRELGLSPAHFIPVDEKPQVEQPVEERQSDQTEQGFCSLRCASVDDSSQRGHQAESEEPVLSPFHSIPPEVESQDSMSCSVKTQESTILNIADLKIESTDLLISPEVKENEDNNVESSTNTPSQYFTLAEGDDSTHVGMSLPSAEVANLTEVKAGTQESAGGDFSESQSEK
ncbi:protein Niban 1 [Eublepharis macularius]|uniref:Protein Niban 1 n=1 Tax=Eublepharis macularius TaxID=481883 RepID=A0AA97L018_EUBMA|nr:protein Niban 1 [Eublepharis macularius]